MLNNPVSVEIDYYAPLSFVNSAIAERVAQVPTDVMPFMYAFQTIEGEGGDVGRPRVLARVSGCAVGCSWCDSVYTWKVKGPKTQLVPIDEVYRQIVEVADGLNEVSITGGDPMHYPRQLYALASQLRTNGFFLNLETSGLMLSKAIFSLFNTVGLDLKGPSSGLVLSEENIIRIKECYHSHPGVQLKMVVETEEDLNWIEKYFEDILDGDNRGKQRPIVLTPCANTSLGKALNLPGIQQTVDMVVAWNRNFNMKVIPQIHKMLYVDPAYDA